MRILIDGSRRVAAGDFAHRIQLNTHDEVAELAAAMNAMTERFQQIRDDLDAQVQQRTQGGRAQRAVGQRRLPGRRSGPRDQQPVGLDCLGGGVPGIAAARDPARGRGEAEERGQSAEIDVLRRYLRRIQDEAFRCKGITERLLDFSRLGDIQRHDTDLREVVQGVIDMVKHLGKHRQKEILFECTEHVVVHANTQEMKQVVLNIVTNALGQPGRPRDGPGPACGGWTSRRC